MENVVKFEVADEASEVQNSIPLLESHIVNNETETNKTELDLLTVKVETNNQQSVEISPDLEEGVSRPQFFFAPFYHSTRPDPELVSLELERSAPDPEATTKLIKDRYKLIMQASARRKEKEQRDKVKYSRVLCNMINENALETTQLNLYMDNENIKDTTQLLCNMRLDSGDVSENTQSCCVDRDDIEDTTQLLHNMYVAHEKFSKRRQSPHNMHPTSSSLTNNQSEETYENHLEKVFWHNSLKRLFKLNYSEINTIANVSSTDMLNTVASHHKSRVGEALNEVRSDQEDGLQRITFFQSSGRLGSAKRTKTDHTFWEEFSGAPTEEFQAGTSGRP